MSKYNRNKHIKNIKLLEEANSRISKLIKDEKIEECLLLLADCQDVAVALGVHIEKLHGLDTKSVALLEGYCDVLYQLSIVFQDGGGAEEKLSDLEGITRLIADTYQLEFPEKKEIVFMPYNASMWDSLESVWIATKEDEEAEVFVVPIPYYERNTDYSFAEYHYEGDKFPQYVPITYYRDYDLELHRPDVIYIHNPYDEFNYVTSVMPDYYSHKLKNYTDMLVYIPYFIADEDKDLKNVEKYSCLSAVLNADKVIVQSEKIKKVYIDALVKKVSGVSRNIWETKILGLGSPKYDAICKYIYNANAIPEMWKEVIGDKKVILYNTHLSLIMVDKYKLFLKKLRAVIELFKDRDDVVLLWRPHPLMIQTAKSMNPVALDEYMEIVNEFRENRYGIYDDTSDMNRALAISDAYYGSDGSMLPLYKATGKPVLIDNICGFGGY